MTKQNAIAEAEKKASEYGGIWHVVKFGNEFYEVHEKWFTSHIGFSLYHTPDYYSSPIIVRRTTWWDNVVTSFNKLLLWLFKRFIDARRNHRKT